MASGAVGSAGDLAFGAPERPRVSAARRRLPWLLILSLLLHVGLLSALLFLRLRPKQPEWLPPPTVDVIYENGGSKQAPSVPNPAPKQPNTPASLAPEPEATAPPAPTPSPPPRPPPAQAAPQPPQPAPIPAPPQAAQLPIPPQPTEVPPEPVPAPKPPPPNTAPEQMESAIQLIPPRLPPAPPLTMPELTPPHPAPPRPVTPPRPRSPFSAPMAYSLGPSSPASPTARMGRRRLDLAFAPGSGADSLQPLARSDDPEVGEDWLNQVAAWFKRHGYYPPEAGMNGQQGVVTVALEVRHDGQVEAIRLENRSGSPWLDMASLGVFRDAKLPPLPPDVSAAQIPLHFTIHYVIVN